MLDDELTEAIRQEVAAGFGRYTFLIHLIGSRQRHPATQRQTLGMIQ